MGELHERRRSFRVATGGLLLLWRSGRFAGDYSLSDLSIGGCGLRDGPAPALGDRFEGRLRIDGAEHIDLLARVVRRDRDGHTGLTFDAADQGAEDAIHDLLLSALECRGDAAREVLLVHQRPELSVNLVLMLERLGHPVRIACTPLDAVWMLEQRADALHSAIVVQALGDADGRDLVRFLARRYPRIRRVLLVTEAEQPLQGPDGQAHAVLQGPCDLQGLRRALPTAPAPTAGRRRTPSTA